MDFSQRMKNREITQYLKNIGAEAVTCCKGNFHQSFHKHPLFYTTCTSHTCNSCRIQIDTDYRCDISNIDICLNCFNTTNQGDLATISEVYDAAINGKKEVLMGHEDMNKLFVNGMTPLFLAVIHGHKELVAYLLENGDALSVINWERRNGIIPHCNR